jgi:hypothetical protein
MFRDQASVSNTHMISPQVNAWNASQEKIFNDTQATGFTHDRKTYEYMSETKSMMGRVTHGEFGDTQKNLDYKREIEAQGPLKKSGAPQKGAVKIDFLDYGSNIRSVRMKNTDYAKSP